MTDDQMSKPGKSQQELALSRMREEIEELAKSKAEDILAEAQSQVDEILAEAKKEANRITQSQVDEARNRAAQEQVREVSRKKQAIKMNYLQSREAIIEEVHDAARKELENFTKSGDYAPFLEKVVKSSALSIGGGDLKVVLRKDDRAHLSSDKLGNISKAVTKETGIETSLSIADTELKGLGGIRMVRADDKLFIDNSFESRLQRADEEIRVELLKLFS